MDKIVIIDSCYKCPYFDNVYYTYREFCMKLDANITNPEHVPENCPLEDAGEQ